MSRDASNELLKNLNAIFATGGGLVSCIRDKKDELFKKELARLPISVGGSTFKQYCESNNLSLDDKWEVLKPRGQNWLKTALPEGMLEEKKQELIDLVTGYYYQDVLGTLPGVMLFFAPYIDESISWVTRDNLPTTKLSYDELHSNWKFEVKFMLQFQTSLYLSNTNTHLKTFSEEIQLHYELRLTEKGFSIASFNCNNEVVKNAILASTNEAECARVWRYYLFPVLKEAVKKFQAQYDDYRNGKTLWTRDVYSDFVSHGAQKLINFIKLNPGPYDLSGIDLSGVDLRDANLSGADLSNVNLSVVKNLVGMIIDEDTRFADDTVPPNFLSIVKYQLTKKQVEKINNEIYRQTDSSFAVDNARNNFAVKKTNGTVLNFYDYLKQLPEIKQSASEKKVTCQKIFQDLSVVEKEKICVTWLQDGLKLDEATAKKHVSAYKQGEINLINDLMGGFYNDTISSLGTASIQMNVGDKISTQYVKKNGQVKLIQTFSPFFSDKLNLVDSNNFICEVLGELGEFTCVFVLNADGNYVLESAQCDNLLLYNILMKTKDALKQGEYHQVIFNVIKDYVMNLDNLLLREKVEKLINISGRLALLSVDLSNLDLSNANLSKLNLTEANLTGADLTGAYLTDTIISSTTKLNGVKFEKCSVSSIKFRFEDGIEAITIQEEFCKLITKFGANTPGAVLPENYLSRNFGKNILRILQYAQENPTHRIAEVVRYVHDHLHLEAIRQSAEKPTPKTSSVITEKGLNSHQLFGLIDQIQFTANSKSVTKTLYNARESAGRHSVSFQLLENENSRVINIANTLCNKKYGKDNAIGIFDFARLMADLKVLTQGISPKIGLIQMPIADGDHYMQLEIYKTNNGIGARVIDSMTNPFHVDPTGFIKQLLINNSEQLGAVLDAASNTVPVVNVISTKEQLKPSDEKSIIDVAAGMKATAEKVLAEGTEFLLDDVKAKNAVRHQHHLVSKTEAVGYVMGMVNAKQSSGGQDKTPAYTHINKLLESLDANNLKTAVESALTSYQKNRGWTLNFFRQLSSAGKDYAADALKRIENGSPEVAREIAREILFMGVKEDGQTIEVKHNSRVHHLLMEMSEKKLIKIDQINLQDVAYAGMEFKAEKIERVGDATSPISSATS